MGIAVTCPNGHQFKVKDKYAGKKGLCPHCEGQVVVRVPSSRASKDFETAVHRAAAEDRAALSGINKRVKSKQGAHSKAGDKVAQVMPQQVNDSDSIFDEPTTHDAGTSGSLLGSSIVRHNVKCECGEQVPMWFARCPKCGVFMPPR